LKSDSSIEYQVQIDGLRFLAILGVLTQHWWVPFIFNPYLSKVPWGTGVNLFFVISGYLITMVLIKAAQKIRAGASTVGREIARFFYRRSLRIFPLYFIVVGLYAYYTGCDLSQIKIYLFTYTINLANSFDIIGPPPTGHLWSLAVEEQFYLLWPFLLLMIPFKRYPIIFIFFLAICVAAKIYFEYYTGWWRAVNTFTVCCFDALVFGAIIAYVKSFNVFKYRPVIARVLIVLLTAFFFYVYIIDPVGKQLSDVSYGFVTCLIYALTVYIAANGGFKYLGKLLLENPVTVYFGKISYGVYLIHNFCLVLFFYGGFSNYFPPMHTQSEYFFCFLVMTVVMASFSWFAIERPILSLKNKLFK
jgi:peptidoglycan/LPS O-acetylase OafA/YrhL